MKQFIKSYWWIGLVMTLFIVIAVIFIPGDFRKIKASNEKKGFVWDIPDSNRIYNEPDAELIKYGLKLIAQTSYYLGPKGIVAAISNGMNCQNCHLDAGTKSWGNNYSAVYATYPKFRARSGQIENIYKRINDCFERSLNGKSLDTNSREMRSLYAYIKWLGKNVPKDIKPEGVGISDIPFLNRSADPVAGKLVYNQICQRCHTANGGGVLDGYGTNYQYPPLWGEHSYTTGAGLYRLSRFAGYVKYNMPFGCTKDSFQLSNEEAWDVAAFVNSQPRPEKNFNTDWPDISRKPFDHPFGPYIDSFSEQQHKYGPFGPMVNANKNRF